MVRLSSEEVLKENKTRDPDSIVSLSLTHKALSDVSCLSDFKNLEKLDLSFNNLTSLEGLRECVNLKWLSVDQNKLQSLKGIEGLAKLTVLKAGKNKIRSVEEVKKLINLCALIMNDNEIVSISNLDALRSLNTLVLSRNPLRKILLGKFKSMSKLSLSNCQLEAIDSSIKACTELKELRLAHNSIKTLPAELAHNIKLQNLDLGNNTVSRWSDLQVLSSLKNLRNLNLHGNPVDEKDKLLKKVKKLVPNIRIFNSKPIEKYNKIEQHTTLEDPPTANAPETLDGEDSKKEKKVNNRSTDQNGIGGNEDSDNDEGRKKKEKKRKKKSKEHSEKDASTEDPERSGSEKKQKKKEGRSGLEVIDDRETPFAEFLDSDIRESEEEAQNKSVRELDAVSNLVIEPAKKKKKKKKSKGGGLSSLQSLSAVPEVGLGGSSAWDDE